MVSEGGDEMVLASDDDLRWRDEVHEATMTWRKAGETRGREILRMLWAERIEEGLTRESMKAMSVVLNGFWEDKVVGDFL